jgi:type III secretory pathway component EscT
MNANMLAVGIVLGFAIGFVMWLAEMAPALARLTNALG